MTIQTAGRRVLIIDDHLDLAESFRDFLELLGHDVEIAHTGEEGLQMIRDLRPELVFCDWRLPDLAGRQVAMAVRGDPAIAATFMVSLTGFSDELVRKSAMDAGFDLHLVKPPDIDLLEELLDSDLSVPR